MYFEETASFPATAVKHNLLIWSHIVSQRDSRVSLDCGARLASSVIVAFVSTAVTKVAVTTTKVAHEVYL